MRKYLICIVILFISSTISKAQDPQLTQFYNNPVYLNPANAGATKTGRLIYNYRTQWPKITRLKTTLISFDYFLPLLDKNTAFGIAILYMNDVAGDNLSLIKNNINIAVSIEKPVWSNWRIRGGIQYGYFGRRIGDDAGQLQFEDALITGGITSEDFYGMLGEKVTYSDISVGTVLSGESLWFGAAAHHLNSPNQSISNVDYGDDMEKLHVKWTINAGWEILKVETSTGSFSRALKVESMYLKQGKNAQFIAGFNYTIGWGLSKNQTDGGDGRYDDKEKSSEADISLTAGIWFRAIPLFGQVDQNVSADAIAFHLGIETEAIESLTVGLGYSYDHNISSLNVTGAHEISLTLRTKQFFEGLKGCEKPMKWSRRRKYPANRSYL